jgi:hypothetical protein
MTSVTYSFLDETESTIKHQSPIRIDQDLTKVPEVSGLNSITTTGILDIRRFEIRHFNFMSLLLK